MAAVANSKANANSKVFFIVIVIKSLGCKNKNYSESRDGFLKKIEIKEVTRPRKPTLPRNCA
jgi:hypothetical protein